MDDTMMTLMTIIGPLILLALLIWAAARSRRPKPGEANETTTEAATKANYAAEEQSRRDGTDGL